MTLRKPLVIISGLSSQLPPGDTIEGAAVSSVATAGSGLSGGGAVGSDFRFDLVLASNPSGLYFTPGASGLGIDGSALASGNAGISTGLTALASGNAGISTGLTALAAANTALASGNEALAVAATKATLGLVVGLS